MNGGVVGTKHAEVPPAPAVSLRTRILMRIAGVGDDGPLVSTRWSSQSIAAVAPTPAVPRGNFVPALRAMVSAEFPLKMHEPQLPGPDSSNINATPGAPGSYPP